jgi:hypothetical protein
MNKRYIVDLTADERDNLLALLGKGVAPITSVKVVEFWGCFEVAIDHSACGVSCSRCLSAGVVLSSAMPSICM